MHEPTSQTIQVQIDARVWCDVAQFFPLEGHHKTKASNAECQKIVCLFIWTALRDANCCFSFNQSVMDCMSLVGSKKRKRIVEYFSQSQFFEVAQNYQTGRNSIIWKLSKAKVKRVSGYQHSECDVEAPAYFSIVRWQYAGAVVTENLPVEWISDYDRSFRRACSILFPEQWAFVPLIESSIAKLVIGNVSYKDCLDAAHSRNLSGTSPEVKADLYQHSWGSWQERPLSYLTRKSGRAYYGLTNQSKYLRRNHLNFVCDGGVEKTAEIDMSSTYWVLLTAMLDDSRCKDTLIRDITDGVFYQKLNQATGNVFTDTQSLKAAVNKDCLFGKRDFGKTSLFIAMQKLFPDLARFIRHKRLHHDVSWLSDLLTNAEGSFFIDLLLPFVVNAGTPALTIHDAVIVPASKASQVASWCSDLAVKHFGFSPRFKTQL